MLKELSRAHSDNVFKALPPECDANYIATMESNIVKEYNSRLLELSALIKA